MDKYINDAGISTSKKIGKVGENAYQKQLEYLKSKGVIRDYLDLRDSKLFRLADCDFAVYPNDSISRLITVQAAENLLMEKNKSHLEYCRFVDVKTDQVVLETGNIFLELIMHGGPGCFGCTWADNWIYVSLDEFGRDIVKAWSLDVRKTRKLMVDGFLRAGVNLKETRQDGSVALSYLVKTKLLEELGALKEIKL